MFLSVALVFLKIFWTCFKHLLKCFLAFLILCMWCTISQHPALETPGHKHNCICSSTRQVGLIIRRIDIARTVSSLTSYLHILSGRKQMGEKARAGVSWFQKAKVKASHGLVTTVEAAEWPGLCGCRCELCLLTTRRNCLDLFPTQDPVSPFLASAWGIKVYLPMSNSVSAFPPVFGKFPLHWIKFCFDPGSINTGK